jgi:hypothetical protein
VRNPHEIEVTFDRQQQLYLGRLAQRRQGIKNRNLDLVRDKRIDEKQDNVSMHYVGLMGEFATSILIGEPLDEAAHLHGDVKKDFTLWGLGVEVKTLQGFLAFDTMAHFKTDIAVLVIHDPDLKDRVWVQGWTTHAEFVKHHFWDNFNHGNKPSFQPTRLFPITTLTTFCYMESLRRGPVNEPMALSGSLF